MKGWSGAVVDKTSIPSGPLKNLDFSSNVSILQEQTLTSSQSLFDERFDHQWKKGGGIFVLIISVIPKKKGLVRRNWNKYYMGENLTERSLKVDYLRIGIVGSSLYWRYNGNILGANFTDVINVTTLWE